MPEMRKCAYCGGLFPPRKPYQRCCSLSCASRLKSQLQTAQYPGWSDGTYKRQVCASCGKAFDRRERETPGDYFRRVYCSRQCRFEAQRSPEGRAAAKARFAQALERGTQYHMTKEEKARIRERMRLFLDLCGIWPRETKKLLDEAPPLIPSAD